MTDEQLCPICGGCGGDNGDCPACGGDGVLPIVPQVRRKTPHELSQRIGELERQVFTLTRERDVAVQKAADYRAGVEAYRADFREAGMHPTTHSLSRAWEQRMVSDVEAYDSSGY